MSVPARDPWFVFDRYQCDFTTFPTEQKAREYYTKLISDINREVDPDGYDGDEEVILGRILDRAELLQVGEDGTEALYSLVSCPVEVQG